MTKACTQCRQVKGKCSLVKKGPAMPSTPTKACKRPRVGEAEASKVSVVREKGAEVVGEEELWGKRVCKGLA